MNKIDKKRVDKAYLKIDSIAKKGKEGYIEYKGYIDELIDDHKYYILEGVLERKYKLDTYKYTPLDIKSEKIYDLIRLQTSSKFQESLKKLYDSYQLYAIGINIYRISNNQKIGEISEVSKPGSTEPGKDIVVALNLDNIETIIDDDQVSTIDKYKQAIDFLLS